MDVPRLGIHILIRAIMHLSSLTTLIRRGEEEYVICHTSKPSTQSSNPSNSVFLLVFGVSTVKYMVSSSLPLQDTGIVRWGLLTCYGFWRLTRTPEEPLRIHSVTHSLNHSQPKCASHHAKYYTWYGMVWYGITLHYHVEGDIQRVGCTNIINWFDGNKGFTSNCRYDIHTFS